MKKNVFKILVPVLLLAPLALTGCTTAPSGTDQPGGGLTGSLPLVIMLVLIVAMFYFFVARPVRQREKRHDTLVEQLQRGDTVITAGGIYGQVESIEENSILIKVESGATMRVTKGGIVAKQER